MIPRNRFVHYAVLLLAFVLLAGCAYGPTVRTDADPAADFSRFRSWAFYSPLAMEEEGYSNYMTERVKSVVRAQMQSRGYAYDESDPDLLVNFNGTIEERLDYYGPYGGGFGFPHHGFHGGFHGRRGFHRGFHHASFGYDYYPTRYTEGTLNIDLVDAERRRLAWEGVSVDRVARRGTAEQRMIELDQAVIGIFSQFPHRAGAAAPPI